MTSSSSSGAAPTKPAISEERQGIFYALGANLLWGGFPVYFKTVVAVEPVLVVMHRVIWSAALLMGILGARGRLGELKAVLQSPKAMLGLVASTLLLAANWLLFFWGVVQELVLQVSLAYFINPLISLALGMVLLGERLNRRQMLAVGVAAVGIGLQSAGLGALPWLSLGIASCFAFYSYVRKVVPVGPSAGLLAETLILLPVALGYLVFYIASHGWGVHADPTLMFWLVLSGPVTTAALVLFTNGARRLPLSTLGMLQFIAPSLHFMFAVWLFNEPLNPLKLISFVVIWIALGIYTYDLIKRGRAAATAAAGEVH